MKRPLRWAGRNKETVVIKEQPKCSDYTVITINSPHYPGFNEYRVLGPCVGCGAIGYSLSMAGPLWCCECDTTAGGWTDSWRIRAWRILEHNLDNPEAWTQVADLHKAIQDYRNKRRLS